MVSTLQCLKSKDAFKIIKSMSFWNSCIDLGYCNAKEIRHISHHESLFLDLLQPLECSLLSMAYEMGNKNSIRALINNRATYLPKWLQYEPCFLALISRADPNTTLMVASSSQNNFNLFKKCWEGKMAMNSKLIISSGLGRFFKATLPLKYLCRIQIMNQHDDLHLLPIPRVLKTFLNFQQ